MTNELDRIIGKTIDSYKIIDYINKGKSGAVYLAKDKSGNEVAFKVIFNSIISSYGAEMQEYRIQKEVSLKDHHINGLIKILDGGISKKSGEDFFYIVMEHIKGKNLKEYIETENYNEDFIKKVLFSLVDSTEALIKKNLAHRDIKPENIMVDEKSNIILMDLGVMKQLGVYKTESESSEKFFISTQRYAPPELLFREEKDDAEGWRAINLYQIGAVLHDLITKKELFHDYSPYTNIVRAIEHDTPKINNTSFSSNLINLTRNLLVKSPNIRLNLSSPEKINNYINSSEELDDLDVEIQKSNNLNLIYEEKIEEISRHKKTKEEIKLKRTELLNNIRETIVNSMNILKDKNIFSEFSIGRDFKYKSKVNNSDNFSTTNLAFCIHKNLLFGFPHNFYFSLGLNVNEQSVCLIESVAFYSGLLPIPDIDHFEHIVLKALNPGKDIPNPGGIMSQFIHGQLNIKKEPKTILLFEGVFENDDVFKKNIILKMAKLLNKAKEIGKADTEEEIQINKEFTLGTRKMSVSTGNKIYFLDSI